MLRISAIIVMLVSAGLSHAAERSIQGVVRRGISIYTQTARSDPATTTAFGLVRGEIVVIIHCGSRGLGCQIGTEFLREMVLAAAD
jgi:hypothetical protein